MTDLPTGSWQEKIVSPRDVLKYVEPGMSIFLGTGMAEPRTLVKSLMSSDQPNIKDLEMIQLISLGDTVPIDARYSEKYRLKTFYSGWTASASISEGRVDLIPSRFSRIPLLFKTGVIRIDMAFIQITPFDESGYASLGVGVDVARHAMEHATVVVGEINELIPRTLGDTLVRIEEFDYLVLATEPPIYLERWPVNEVFDKLAARVASVIKDDNCLSFSIGPLYDALGQHLSQKKNLGIHTPFFTDALMDLIKSGAVTNRRKAFFPGKSLTSYALGTAELMRWLDRNSLVEFQPIDVIQNPKNIGLNSNFTAIMPAKKVDLTGDIGLHGGRGNVTGGRGAVQELFVGASLSENGRTIFALPSRSRHGESNIVLSIADYPHRFTNRDSLDMIITEYGVAYLTGRTIRERAQSLIDIAHPDDRMELVRQAKEANILYADQIYFADSGRDYPEEIACTHNFKEGLHINFRAIKPSDEEEMRRLFYRFSDQAVYYRYFSPIRTMPHSRMQEYVNMDYHSSMSIVGVIEESGRERIIAEARYILWKNLERPYADTAFIVDEHYQGQGIAAFMLELLIRTARKRGIEGFTADVLIDNAPMLRVFERASFQVQSSPNHGIYSLKLPFTDELQKENNASPI